MEGPAPMRESRSMKGRISLGDFIHEVKRELVEAQDDSDEAFYELQEAQLEASFAVDISAKAGAKLVVLGLGGESRAQQTHKVTLTLAPIDRGVKGKKVTKSKRGPSRKKKRLPRYKRA